MPRAHPGRHPEPDHQDPGRWQPEAQSARALRPARDGSGGLARGDERPDPARRLAQGQGHALISAEGALHNVQIAYVPETELRRVPRGAPRLAQWDEADPEVIGARTAGQ